MSELEKEIFNEEDEEVEEKDERSEFVVDDDSKAEWCLDKIKYHKEQIEMWKAHYEAQSRRACMKHENAIMRRESDLRGYFFLLMHEGVTRETKTQKAYDLPHGKLVLKHQEPEYERDDEQIIEWLRKNAPEYIKVKETVDWAGLKKALVVSEDSMVVVDDETGEIIKVPGIKVTSRDDIFKVEVK